MRMVTAATRWRTTCSVTPATSRGWRKGPRLHPSTSNTSSKKTQMGCGAGRGGFCVALLSSPMAGAQEEEGQEVEFLCVCTCAHVCAKGIFLLTTAGSTPHPVRVFPKYFSLLPHSPHRITQEDAPACTWPLTQDGACVTGHTYSLESRFSDCVEHILQGP